MELAFQIDRRTCGSDFFEALRGYLRREEIEKMRIRIADEVFAAAGLEGVSVLIGKITGLKEPQRIVLELPNGVPDWRVGKLTAEVAMSLGSFVSKAQAIDEEGRKRHVTVQDFEASRQGLKEFVENAPSRLEDELAKTKNPWLACFKSAIFGLAGHIAFFEQTGKLTGIELVEWQERLAAIAAFTKEVQIQYGWNPPDEIKARLLKELNELLVCAD